MRQKIGRLSVRVCTVVICMFISGALFAQRKVSGTVTSARTSQPVAFATITVKGTNVATASDVSGAFTITVPAGKTVLTVSSVGFADQDVTIGSGPVNVVLADQVSNLDEIVVTGYTAQKKKEITGSVSVVNVKDLKSVPAGTTEQMLQGQASGVTVINSGSPGENSTVLIRGISSFGNVDPLVIIDGVPGSMHDLNAQDIESFQVVKDAAAAIYGVRGSAGVVIITTKKGKAGKSTITYDGYYGSQVPKGGNVFNKLDPQGMADLYFLQAKNSGQVDAQGNVNSAQYGKGTSPRLPDYLVIGSTSGVVGQPTQAQLDAYNIDYDKGDIYQIVAANKQGTDWFHSIFKNAPIQNHNLTASGGNEKSTYLFSLNYFDQQGSMLNTHLKRYAVRANTTFNIKNNIRVGENAYIYYRDNPRPSPNAEGNEVSQASWEQPIIPIFDVMGNYAGTRGNELGNSGSPYASRDRAKNNTGNDWVITGNVWGEADFLKHFTARTQFGGTIDNYYYWGFNYRTYENKENGSSNSYYEGSGFGTDWTWTNTLSYSNIFARNHSVKAIIGSEAIQYYGRGESGQRLNYFSLDPNYWTLSTGSPAGQTNSSSVYKSTIYSLFARVDYAFMEKYLLQGNVRRDQASVLGDSTRTGYFGSGSIGWRISKEGFMKDISWINDLKLRGSYGVLGTVANTSAYNSFELYGTGAGSSYYAIDGSTGNTAQGFYHSQLANPKTGWEGDKITNVGLDAVLFKNSLDVTVEWYKKAVNGLLFQDQAGDVVGGATRPNVNIGDLQNTGIDASVSYHKNISRDLSFNIAVNITTYKSKVTAIPGAAGFFEAGGTRLGNVARNMVGHPVGEFYGYKIIGFFQSQADVDKSPTQADAAVGEFKYADIDGDGKITDADRTFLGDPNPKFTYGANLGLTYKNFDFSMILYGSQGGKLFNYNALFMDFPYFQNAKSNDMLYNSWTPTNTSPRLPIALNDVNFSTGGVVNSYLVQDGSYLRCKQMQIGYNFKSDLLKKVGLDRARIYVQGANLFTITKYRGLDPEVANLGTAQFFGIDYGSYPPIKTFLVGVNLSF
ncbi:MAG TPA: TonB-dependent receptor [Chitinophagaceae bacterium]|nr:TonB-dependent receptor [Chitinophagaceae bacterium]